MSSTLATGAYRRAVDRDHESLAAVRLSLAPSSPTAPAGADQGLRAALQGRTAIHARILEVTEEGVPRLAPAPPSA